MKSVEEVKAEITNNSNNVTLSNGQSIYIDRITSNKAVIVYVKDDKNPYGFKKVVSVPKAADRDSMIEHIAEYIDLDMPSLVGKSMSEYKNEISSINAEIADAILNEPTTPEVEIEEVEAKEVINYEIEEGHISYVTLHVDKKNIGPQYRATEQQLNFINALVKKNRSHQILDEYYMKHFVSKKLASKIIDLMQSQSIIRMIKKGEISQKEAYNKLMSLINE